MKQYNYFDDDAVLEERYSQKTSFSTFAVRLAAQTGGLVRQAARGALAVSEDGDFSIKKRILLRLLAFVIFLLVLVIFIFCFLHSITSQNKKNELFYADAGAVCTQYIAKYGSGKIETLDAEKYGENMARITGLAYARQMDFNHDDSDELMICYSDNGIYYLEVWGYMNGDFSKIYSDEANSTESVKDGSWVVFYHHNNKYYIGKSEKSDPSVIALLALKGDKFKQVSSCDYDLENDIFAVKGKINATDFEKIQLAVIKSTKAEATVDTAAENIDAFKTDSLTDIQSAQSSEDTKESAYYEIIKKYHEKYGEAKVVRDGRSMYVDGLAVVDFIDFDNDGTQEMLLIYRKELRVRNEEDEDGDQFLTTEPVYSMEVYCWNGTGAKKIFSKERISSFFPSSGEEYFYILQKNGSKVNLCNNSYAVTNDTNYTASSKIYELKDEQFSSIYSAVVECSYGYKYYYLDGEKVYRSSFSYRGYRVPMFCSSTEETDYDADEFTVTFVSGSYEREDELKTVLVKTTAQIRTVYPEYTPAQKDD